MTEKYRFPRDQGSQPGAVRELMTNATGHPQAYVVPVMPLAGSPWTLTTAPLTGNATYAQPWQDRMSQVAVDRVLVGVYADQTGTLIIEESHDASTPATVSTVTVTAGRLVPTGWLPLSRRYWRVRYVNGAQAQTVFQLAVRVQDGQTAAGYDPTDDMLKVKSMQKKFRDSFPGSTLDPTKWRIVQTGAGMTISTTTVAGELRISSGTTANAETIIESLEAFTVPFRAMFGVMVSQKIANCDTVLEMVSVDPVTLEPNGLHSMAWRISGSDNTTVTNAVYQVQNGGLARLDSANSTVVSLTSFSILELEAHPDEAYFHSRAIDSTSARSNSYVRHQQIPDPNGVYKLRMRVLNRATPPASNTDVRFQFVLVTDYAELTAELVAGRGNTVAGQGISAVLAGGSTTITSGTVTANAAQNALWYTDSTSTLGSSASFTGTSRDAGSSTLAHTKFRALVQATATAGIGHIAFEQSTDASTWRETHRIPVPQDGRPRIYEFAQVLRYGRIRYYNGATAQSAYLLQTALIRMDGPSPDLMSKNLSIIHTVTNLSASASFTGDTMQLGANHNWDLHRATVFASHAGTLYLEQSRDGTNWRSTVTQAVAANTPVVVEDRITTDFVRVRYVNGGTLTTTFELVSSLVAR